VSSSGPARLESGWEGWLEKFLVEGRTYFEHVDGGEGAADDALDVAFGEEVFGHGLFVGDGCHFWIERVD
jgi:hypothetical protein